VNPPLARRGESTDTADVAVVPKRRWARRKRPSLHRRLLAFLMGPVLMALVLDAILIYLAALTYSNHVHDRDLIEDAMALASVVADEERPGELSRQARFLVTHDREQTDYFRIVSSSDGLLAENARIEPEPGHPSLQQSSILADAHVGTLAVRAATVVIASKTRDGELLWISVAESLHDRHVKAREILEIALPMLGLLIVVVLLLVWFGVGHGLRVIDRLTARLASQSPGMVSVSSADVPIELLPLTRTIDDLFARLNSALAAQERFVADAAHQLRTPLAGLDLHVQRALADPREATVRDALAHIEELSRRVARTSSQLLVLSRADADVSRPAQGARFDLTAQVSALINERVDEVIARHCEIACEGMRKPLMLNGDANLIHDLLDNLIDNALCYAGEGCSITVSLHRDQDAVTLAVEDDGPGVADAHLHRLGERFFRVPGQNEPGTGLGLAIVVQIAERFGANVSFLHGRLHRGLRVEVVFPLSKGD
jgi:two-component system, OmpR family, sensor histidine kinase TctE